MYGDDHVIAVAPEMMDRVDFQKFRSKMQQHNLGYTDSQKNVVSDFRFEKLEDISYLKRKFLKLDGIPDIVFAPLDEDSVNEQLNWIKNNGDNYHPWEMTRMNIESYSESIVTGKQIGRAHV